MQYIGQDGKIYNESQIENGKWVKGTSVYVTPLKQNNQASTSSYQNTSANVNNYNQNTNRSYSGNVNNDILNQVRSMITSSKPNLNIDIPKYTPRSLDTLQQEARLKADLQVNPLIDALKRRLNEIDAEYATSKQEIEAAYGGVGTEANRLLEEARQKALESAIARGGGRSGAVEYMTDKMSQPILENVAQAEREKAAKLAGLENNLNTYRKNISENLTSLEERRGALINDYLNTLQQQERALEMGNHELALRLAEKAADLQMQWERMTNDITLNVLPYFTMTAKDRDNSYQNWSEITGQVVNPSANKQPQYQALRDVAAKSGVNIGYKPTSAQTIDGKTYYGNVIVNNKEYTPQQLLGMGAVFDFNENRWKIPQSLISKLA